MPDAIALAIVVLHNSLLSVFGRRSARQYVIGNISVVLPTNVQLNGESRNSVTYGVL